MSGWRVLVSRLGKLIAPCSLLKHREAHFAELTGRRDAWRLPRMRTEASSSQTTVGMRLLQAMGGFLLIALFVLTSIWTALALRWSPILPESFRPIAGWGYAAFALLLLWLARRRRLIVLAHVVAFALIALRFLTLEPARDRDWRPDVAVLPKPVVDGDRLTIRDFRNFDWTSSDEAKSHYEDRTFDLTRLAATDLVVSYWDGNESIAHTMLSFDFGGVDVLCLSVEVRRARGQEYGALPGMFKSFEIAYILGDERDLIRVRTNRRNEQVFVFRTALSAAESRQLLLHVLEHAAHLADHPEFYRTLANNCTTTLVDHVDAIWPNRTPYTRRILMNGYAPEQGYERGMLKSSLPFEEYKRRSCVNAAALAADTAPDFSRRIRASLPQE